MSEGKSSLGKEKLGQEKSQQEEAATVSVYEASKKIHSSERSSFAGRTLEADVPTKLIGNPVLKRAESREVPNAERKATCSHR